MAQRVLIIALAAAFTAFPTAADPQDVTEVAIVDAQGQRIGSAHLTPTPQGVQIAVAVTGLSSHGHGLHIHDRGVCEPPDFASAGSHFQPDHRSHGFLDADGPHAGDLPMLMPEEGGKVSDYRFTTSRVALAEDSLRQPEGTSLIIHAAPDDYLTDTGGGTGARIACGVISPADEAAGD